MDLLWSGAFFAGLEERLEWVGSGRKGDGITLTATLPIYFLPR